MRTIKWGLIPGQRPFFGGLIVLYSLFFLREKKEMIVRTVRTPKKSMISMGFADDPPSSATVRIVRSTGVENV
jgi:hypothetical protein